MINLNEEELKEITDSANNAINSMCPQLERDIKPYMVRYVIEALNKKETNGKNLSHSRDLPAI